MESYLFRNLEAEPDTLVVEGWHHPGSLTRTSGGAARAEAGGAVRRTGRDTRSGDDIAASASKGGGAPSGRRHPASIQRRRTHHSGT